jgi:hypothetical protein
VTRGGRLPPNYRRRGLSAHLLEAGDLEVEAQQSRAVLALLEAISEMEPDAGST